MRTHEQFTPEEQALLAPYVTNTDQSIFVLKNLPEVIKGALFSRYSRSTLGLRRLLLKEFIQNRDSALQKIRSKPIEEWNEDALAIERARDFYDRILDGYGDDSIGELGGAHLAIENISILATKHIQDARIGGSPLEKSTRYVTFSKKVGDDYLYYKDPKLLNSSHRSLYLEINRNLFDTYASLFEPVSTYVRHWMPREESMDEGSYNRSVRAKVFDVIRGLLPASTLTNMGIFGNGRFFEALLSKLQTYPLSELRETAHETYTELRKTIPSFVRRAHWQHRHFKSFRDFSFKTTKLASELAATYLTEMPVQNAETVRLIDYDPDAETKLLAAMLYPHASQSLSQIRRVVDRLSPTEKEKIIQGSVALRENRRHKPGRELEMVYYTFDIQGDYGMYRDLQRHRMLTQERQLLSTRFGYHMPPEIEAAGVAKAYRDGMKAAEHAYETIAVGFPIEAQYVVPLSYNIRWYMRINLRALTWLIELRSTPQGHENYRRVAQELFRKVQEVHPLLAQYIKFVDLDRYPLGRLDGENRLHQKGRISTFSKQ